MTTEQIVELILLARRDTALWAEMMARERQLEKRYADAEAQGRDPFEPDAVLDPPKLPTLVRMVADLVRRRYGAHETVSLGVLILAIRRCVREDLGLPTDLGFDLDDAD